MSTEPDLSEFTALTEVQELRAANAVLATQLRRAKAKVEDLVEATIAAARAAMVAFGPVPPVPEPTIDTRSTDPEVALWDLGDWQGAKRTVSYNSEVMRERVMKYCDLAEKFTNLHRAHHPVRECVIVFGGDMVEGLFNFPTQPMEIDQTIHGQYVTVSRLLVDVVRRALSIYEKVTVVPEWGNHGRIGSKRDVVPSADNFDRMCYELARQLLDMSESSGRLTWPDCPEGIQRLEVGNYRALVIHGDEVGRNGYASPDTIAAWVTRQQSGAYTVDGKAWPFRDVYCHHYHQHGEKALANGLGSLYFNGSTESDNLYARDNMAATAVPSQRLHFIDPDEGRVVGVHKIWLA